MPTNYDDQDSSHYLKSQGEGNERQDSGVVPKSEKKMQCNKRKEK